MRLTAPAIRARSGGNRGVASSTTSATSSARTSPKSTSGVSGSRGLGNSRNIRSLPESLPDIYHFSSMGVGVEGRYSFTPAATQQPQNLFVPSSPRIAEDEKFNFDYGALTAELEETSYMAWF